MAENYYTIITNLGKARLANAQVLDRKIDITQIAVGDRVYQPNEGQTALENELWRGSIGNLSIDEKNPNWIVLEAVIPSDVGGFNIREVGVLDTAGDLIAISQHPDTYKPKLSEGSAKDLRIRMILEVSNVESVQLKIDPTIAIPSEDWVGREIEKAKSTLIPKSAIGQPNGVAALGSDGKIPNEQLAAAIEDASLTQKGIVQLNDALNSISDTRAATPSAVKKVNDALAEHQVNDSMHLTDGFLKINKGSTNFLLKMDAEGLYLEEV